MTAEYIEKNGYLTAEFSCHHTNLAPVIEAIKEIEDDLARKTGSFWHMFPCETCEKQHGEGYLHVEISRYPDWTPDWKPA